LRVLGLCYANPVRENAFEDREDMSAEGGV